MHERQPRGDAGVAQIGEVARQLRRGQHPLVDDRPAREARERQVGTGGSLDHAADHVKLAFKRALVLDLVGRLDQHLADHRRRQPRGLADEPVVHRHVAPPDRALALGLDRLLDHLLEREPPFGVGGQIADADPVAPGRGQLDAGDRAAHERIRDLEQDPGAVTGIRVRPFGATMLEVLERVERLLDDGMARLPPQLGDKRDAARIVFLVGVVEAGGPRLSGAVHNRVGARSSGGSGTVRLAAKRTSGFDRAGTVGAPRSGI